MKYKRIMLKLSGEGLSGANSNLAIDPQVVHKIAVQVHQLIKDGIEVAIVVGGGNFWRGASAVKNGIHRNKADYIGMLATIMNALALQSSFEHQGLPTRVLSAISMEERIVESYSHERAMKYLKERKAVIFAGGTGRPFFTTDTAATLVATEIEADVILMAKNGVAGIYDADPKINKNAKMFKTIFYEDIILKKLNIMDMTAASMARENNIPSIVFDVSEDNAILSVLKDEIEHTLVTSRKDI